ncbi:cupin domain-containing protein [Sphingobium sp. H39-3-25]|uniref:(R)-mandelonitrile lyase n=1 Tax=Sphingobium arseniciresistens TaxID=3030834 RepID=UPI0023B8A66D|nr:cupin domain-containing protein [Sphingobium arseniciresistens]
MQITRAGSQPSEPASSANFTGAARVDGRFSGSGELSAGTVTFEPGARTDWHAHPLGQTLLVISGYGRVQRDGGPVEEIRPGDIVFFEPGERHWHGAAPNCAMAHVAIAEKQDGTAVTWMNKVSDAEYNS